MTERLTWDDVRAEVTEQQGGSTILPKPTRARAILTSWMLGVIVLGRLPRTQRSRNGQAAQQAASKT